MRVLRVLFVVRVLVVVPVYPSGAASDFPVSFDAREAWPECAAVISHARDQSACGACWAFAAVSAFNDRVCIATRGRFSGLLSTAYMTSCCDIWKLYPAFGCSGGHPKTAWKFLVHHGIPEESCFPYPFPSCDHTLARVGNSCAEISVSTPTCPSRCVGGNPIPGLFRARNFRQIQGIENIKQEISRFGPVSAVLEIFHDFRLYTGGVFNPSYSLRLKFSDHPALRLEGSFTHAVKIFGWGVEAGKEYWLIGNSWNASWGEGGTGKIQMRLFGVEQEVFAADWDEENSEL